MQEKNSRDSLQIQSAPTWLLWAETNAHLHQSWVYYSDPYNVTVEEESAFVERKTESCKTALSSGPVRPETP